MKIRAEALRGKYLDYAVITAAGFTFVQVDDQFIGKLWAIRTDGQKFMLSSEAPGTSWNDAGSLLESMFKGGLVLRSLENDDPPTKGVAAVYRGHRITSSHPLRAAMRCFVAAHIGDEVDIPEEADLKINGGTK